MDWERHKITAETVAIRGRGWLSLLLRLAGIAVLIVAATNFMFGWQGYVFPFEVYRGLWAEMVGVKPWPLADFIAMGVGASIAHFL